MRRRNAVAIRNSVVPDSKCVQVLADRVRIVGLVDVRAHMVHVQRALVPAINGRMSVKLSVDDMFL